MTTIEDGSKRKTKAKLKTIQIHLKPKEQSYEYKTTQTGGHTSGPDMAWL